MPSDAPAPLALVPVARFQSAEEADAFSAVAAECGVGTRLLDARRVTTGFDGTLGGTVHPMGFSVYVRADEVAQLRIHLESAIVLDPLDPLHTAGRAELLAIAEGPTAGNLCEQVIARKILAARPPEDTPGIQHDQPTDPHLAHDRRRAHWLAAAGFGFTAIFLTILLNGIHLKSNPDSEYASHSFSAGVWAAVLTDYDPIAGMIRPFLLTLVPMGTGAALFLSWRRLRDGTNRRMFPPFWRLIGQILFWLPVAFLTIFLLAARN